jgi:YfiR/HmsC-like
MRFRVAPWVCLSLALLGLLPGRAQEPPAPSEYQIKAAFLFNFAKFVEWPAEAFAARNSPVVIGVLGDNPFGADLDRTVHGKTVNDHPFAVKELHGIDEGTNCHILFISTSEKKRLPEIFAHLKGVSVLTVGETDGFTETGGMINFVIQGNKIRFQINDTAARNAGLKINSKLITLAVHGAS